MRTREFDEKKIIHAAMLAFWKKGFHETSLAELQDATGLGKASLYNAFNSKEGLFEVVLETYLNEVGKRYQELLSSDSNPKKAIANLLHGIVDAASKPPRGCLLVLSLQNKSEHAVGIRRILESALKAREERLHAIVSKLEFSRLQAAELTKSLCTYIDGLLTSARAGTDVATLHRTIAFTVDRLL